MGKIRWVDSNATNASIACRLIAHRLGLRSCLHVPAN